MSRPVSIGHVLANAIIEVMLLGEAATTPSAATCCRVDLLDSARWNVKYTWYFFMTLCAP